MRLIRQKHPFSDYDTFQLRVWKKRAYIQGWHAHIQIGKRAWLVMPKDRHGPPKRQVKAA